MLNYRSFNGLYLQLEALGDILQAHAAVQQHHRFAEKAESTIFISDDTTDDRFMHSWDSNETRILHRISDRSFCAESGYFSRAFSACSLVLNGLDNGVNSRPTYLKSNHCSTILVITPYSTPVVCLLGPPRCSILYTHRNITPGTLSREVLWPIDSRNRMTGKAARSR
jgi:hypothetical protein